MDCEACIEAPLLEGLRRRATDGDASAIGLDSAIGVELPESTIMCEMVLDGVAASFLDVEGCGGAITSVAATFDEASGAVEPSGLVSRVAVAVATESASVNTSARSGSIATLLLLVLSTGVADFSR